MATENPLPPVDCTVSAALELAIADLKLETRDVAALQLARRYAADIDTDSDLSKLGPALLKCLEQLGATPIARLAKGGKPNEPANPSDLGSRADELRARRNARRSG